MSKTEIETCKKCGGEKKVWYDKYDGDYVFDGAKCMNEDCEEVDDREFPDFLFFTEEEQEELFKPVTSFTKNNAKTN